MLLKTLPIAACAAIILSGCGGAVSTVSSGGGDTGGTREAVGTARIRVDLGSGNVTVTPLDNAGSRAMFTGNAVGVSSSRVLDDVGELTRRAIEVTLTNNTAEPIGANGSFRVVLSDFANLGAPELDYSADTEVSTPATPSRPYGVDTDSDGNVYFSGKTSGQVHKMVGGATAQLASGFNGPAGVAVMPGTDNLVVAENGGNVISLTSLTSGGRTVLAGTGAAGSADGPANAATFDKPDGVTVDSLGNIYVADAGTSRIRMISDPLGTPVVSTLVSSGFTTIADIDAVLIQGTEYLLVATKHAVFGVALPGGQVFSLAGSQTSSGNVTGAGDNARFKLVRGVDAANGAIFVMDSQNYQVKQITLDPGGNPMNSASWHVAVIAGTGVNAHADGVGNVAQFQYSQHLAASPSGRLFVASYSGDAVRQIESTSSVLPFLGSSGSGSLEPVKVTNADGNYNDGTESRPYFDYALSGGIDSSTAFKLDKWAFAIPENVAAFEFVMAVEGETETPALLDAVLTTASPYNGSDNVYTRLLAGDPTRSGFLDGPGSSALLDGPQFLDHAADGTLFFTETFSASVRMMTLDGVVRTIAGDPSRYAPPTNTSGDLVSFYNPSGIQVNDAGTVIYVCDQSADVVCRISLSSTWADRTNPANWNVRIIAGTGVGGYANGDGTVAQFYSPVGLAMTQEDETIFLTDFGLNKVRKLWLAGSDPNNPAHWQVGLVAGTDAATSDSGYADGYRTAARFNRLIGITIGPDQNLYVADRGNDRIRRITPAGDVTTLAGDGTSGHVDSTSGASASFSYLWGLAADPSGYLYAADYGTGSIRRVSLATGETRTVADGGTSPYKDGLGSSFFGNNPYGIDVSDSGDVVVGTYTAIIRMSRIIDNSAR
jgi:sugar lactone lactonase YvrE